MLSDYIIETKIFILINYLKQSDKQNDIIVLTAIMHKTIDKTLYYRNSYSICMNIYNNI